MSKRRLWGETAVKGGSWLLKAVERIGMSAGRNAVRLECVNDPESLSWYAHYGFAVEGEPHEEPEWGTLYPMVRHL